MRIMNVFLVTIALWAVACEGADAVPLDGGTGPSGGPIMPGGDCSKDPTNCEKGYVCGRIQERCVPEGASGLGATPEGDSCPANIECALPYVCAADGTCQEIGQPGTSMAGTKCQDSAECQLFLSCLDGTCQGFQPPFWTGERCPESAKSSDPFVAYFDVKGKNGDFYSLPFPNDIRRDGKGKIDLDDHPNPGILIEEVGNPVQSYFDAVSDLDGFGTLSAVYFRFSHWPDGDSLKIWKGEGQSEKASVFIVNIDKDSPSYGQRAWTQFRADTARGLYICSNWIAIGPSLGNPLLPGTTYAAVLTSGIWKKDAKDKKLGRDADFEAMLEGTKPGDGKLDKAWKDYQPLRDFLADGTLDAEKKLDAADVAVAAVFTTGNPETRVVRTREAVRAEAAPTVSASLSSSGSTADFDLYTGTVKVPFYQDGKLPFRMPEDDGSISYDDKSWPKRITYQDVKMAVSVPKGTVPATGWPVIVYAHGTGGSEMSFVNEEIAKRMAKLGVAVLGWEQVMHGDRRGLKGDEADLESNAPDYLYYNFLNPRAARDSSIQAAADLFQFVRVVEGNLVTGVTLDPAKIYFFGHSQGTQGPYLGAVHEPLVKAIVLSGAGGYLIESLLGKKNPIDVKAAISLAVMDPNIGWSHPLLNIVQAAFDWIEPLNYADNTYRYDFTDKNGKLYTLPRRHVFMSGGAGDTYTPAETQHALSKSLYLRQWPKGTWTGMPDIDALPHTKSVHFGNGVYVTTVFVQYEPDGDYDGHFVMFENKDAVSQLDGFVQSMVTAADGVPILSAP